MQITGNFAAVDPHIVDKLDTDEALDQYATLLGTNPKIIRSAEAVKAIRDAKAKAEQQQQAAEMTPAAVQGAKVLSQTEVGGGQNALAAAMGQGQ
jgi:hypothetical protein